MAIKIIDPVARPIDTKKADENTSVELNIFNLKIQFNIWKNIECHQNIGIFTSINSDLIQSM